MAELTFTQKLVKNQVARFIFSAGMGFLADNIAFYFLVHNILTEPSYHILFDTFHNFTVALAISFSIGVAVNFIVTKYLVFHESKSKSSKQFFRFVLVAIIGFFANWAVVKFFIETVGMSAPVARPLAALSLFFASFFIHKVFSFSLSLRHHAS